MRQLNLRKRSFRVDKFQSEVQRNLSMILQMDYNLELLISYVFAAPDLRSVRIFLFKPIQRANSQDLLLERLREIYLGRFSEHSWQNALKDKTFNGFILHVLQNFSAELTHNLIQKMFCRKAPDLFFKFDERIGVFNIEN